MLSVYDVDEPEIVHVTVAAPVECDQPGVLAVHNEPEPKPDIPTEEEFLAFIRVRKWLGI